jgi:hypothetical protein
MLSPPKVFELCPSLADKQESPHHLSSLEKAEKQTCLEKPATKSGNFELDGGFELPLLVPRPWLTLVANDWMQLNLDWVLSVVPTVALTPIIANSVCKDVASAGKPSGGDASADLWVALETVLSVLVPEVEGAVAAGGAKGAVDGMEGDCIDRVDFCDVALGGVGLAVAFEGEVEAGKVG